METTFTNEEVWMIATLSAIAGMVLLGALLAAVYLFDRYLWKPFQDRRKPLKYGD